AAAGGAAGTVWGLAVCLWISAVHGWWQLRVAQREAGHLLAGHRLLSIRPNWRRRTSPVLAAVPSPDLKVPGDTVRQDSAPTAGASSPATLAPPLPPTPGMPE